MDEQKEENIPKFRGLYRNVHISVKALDTIIVACIVVIILATIFGMKGPGLTVDFDCRGGTDVAPIACEYGDLIRPEQTPTREGYAFGGWYRDPGCTLPWRLDTDTVEDSMTLYACWEALS